VNETIPLASMERLLSDTREALRRMQPTSTAAAGTAAASTAAASTAAAGRDGPAGGGEAAAAPLRAEASDRSGRATAVVASPGRIESLRVDPRLMRDGSEAVCDAIAEAVNAALAKLQDDAIAGAAVIDATGLAVDLERLQADSLASATTMMASLQDAMARISAPVERTRA
jgi:DNA-binding protein YbaB